ncbi:MAG: alpha/beta fold hydrolase [Pseudomonadota bacterium]
MINLHCAASAAFLRATIAVAALTAASLGTPDRASAAQCGAPETPCELDQGVYFAALPNTPDPPPAVIWLHGYGRSGEAMIQNAGYVDPFLRRGYAVIMPSGQPGHGGKALDWGVMDGTDHARDDVAFIQAVRADAIDRFGLDPARILLAGFSRGGSMVWDMACRAPGVARAYAAVAGAFWEPMATDCTRPVDLFHSHGMADRLVPFEGREIVFADTPFIQGSVMKGIQIWRRENGCTGSAENSFGADGSMQKDWDDCASGAIRLRLTTDGHRVPEGWRADVLDWFETHP